MRPAVLMPLLLTGCSSPAEDAVKKLLTDPASAQFSAVATKGTVTCGLVNSKGIGGGYTGPTAFIVDGGTAELASSLEDVLSDKLAKECPESSYHEIMSTSLSRYNQAEKDKRGY